MSLTHIEYGSLASSEVMNNNFEFLDDRITTVAGNLSSAVSGINSGIASINSNLSESINDIESDLDTLETDVSEVRTDFYSRYYTPNYNNAIAVNYTSGDTVGFNGWLGIYYATQDANQQMFMKINGVPVSGIITGSQGGQVDGNACIVLVSETDVITWTGSFGGYPNYLYFYKIPFLGGQ